MLTPQERAERLMYGLDNNDAEALSEAGLVLTADEMLALNEAYRKAAPPQNVGVTADLTQEKADTLVWGNPANDPSDDVTPGHDPAEKEQYAKAGITEINQNSTGHDTPLYTRDNNPKSEAGTKVKK